MHICIFDILISFFSFLKHCIASVYVILQTSTQWTVNNTSHIPKISFCKWKNIYNKVSVGIKSYSSLANHGINFYHDKKKLRTALESDCSVGVVWVAGQWSWLSRCDWCRFCVWNEPSQHDTMCWGRPGAAMHQLQLVWFRFNFASFFPLFSSINTRDCSQSPNKIFNILLYVLYSWDLFKHFKYIFGRIFCKAYIWLSEIKQTENSQNKLTKLVIWCLRLLIFFSSTYFKHGCAAYYMYIYAW